MFYFQNPFGRFGPVSIIWSKTFISDVVFFDNYTEVKRKNISLVYGFPGNAQ